MSPRTGRSRARACSSIWSTRCSSFEGERSHQYRILRAVKNRFGGTDEIGVFAMGEEGLGEVANPSSLFLTDRSRDVPGSVVFPALEGTRPVLVEIQALTVRLASGATPRRAVGRLGQRTARDGARGARGALRAQLREPPKSISTSPAAIA